MKTKDRHHRKPTSMGGKSNAHNVTTVSAHLHRAYHQLFNNMLPQGVAKLLTETWIDPDFYMVAIPRHKSRRKVINTRRGRFLQITFRIERKGEYHEQDESKKG